MSHDPVPLETPAVIARCREEICTFRRDQIRDAPHCYELFRRAVVVDDQQAWTALHDLYGGLVVTWGRCDALDDDEVLQGTWSRFWRSMQSAPAATFAEQFPYIGAVLKYLKRCAVAVRIDAQRAQGRERRLQANAITRLTLSAAVRDPADLVARQSAYEEIYMRIRIHLHDEVDRLVFELSFVERLSPRTIAARHPGCFPLPQAVSRVKERILRRMARDPLLERLWREWKLDA